MKTIFKVGQKVYDQVNFPNLEGKIVEIDNKDFEGFPIVISINNSLIFYTKDGKYAKRQKATLSTAPYEIEFKGFEQKEFIPTYGKIIKEAIQDKKYATLKNVKLPNAELCGAFRALVKLIWLRDCYNEGWQPDWREENTKYNVVCGKDKITIGESYSAQAVLSFKTKEIRDKFLEEQRELLEIAKPLL